MNHNHTAMFPPSPDDLESLDTFLNSIPIMSESLLTGSHLHTHSESDIRRIFREEFGRLGLGSVKRMGDMAMGEAPPLYQERPSQG
jgi:hypothetical protein